MGVNRKETPVALLASVLIHLMVLFAAARWLKQPAPIPESAPEAPPEERITRVVLPPPDVWRPPAPPSQSRPAAPSAPERPQPRPEAKDRVSVGGPAAERQKTPLELRRDEDLTRNVARGRPDATGSAPSPPPARLRATPPPAPAPAVTEDPDTRVASSDPPPDATTPEPAADLADAPLAPSPRPTGPPRVPGPSSIAGSLRQLEERLAEEGARGITSGAGQQMGPLFFDPKGADFTAWYNQFKNEVYRNWIVPPSVAFGARGHVDLEFRVERDGRLSALRIVRSSGTPALDRAARNALLGGRFLPLPDDYAPAQVAMQVSFFYNAAAGS
jgi:periplasmic protein TonB